MKRVALFGLTLVLSSGIWAASAEDNVMKELVPTGKLRVGVAYAPSPTPIFVAKDAAGDVRGVPRDLGAALAKALGVPVEIVVTATTGELTEACSAGSIDIGFMPADDERRKRLDFSPPYFVIESTYLATGPSGIKTIGDVDRTEITVVGIAGSTTMRAAGRSLKTAKLVPAKSVDEAMAMIKAGTVQALPSRMTRCQTCRNSCRVLAFSTVHSRPQASPSPCKRITPLRSPMSPTSSRALRLTVLFDGRSMMPD